VVDLNGDGVVDASVTVKSLQNGFVASSKTDDEGKFSFAGVAAGRYLITVTKSGFAESKKEMTLVDNERQRVNFSLSPGHIRDSVTVTAEEKEDGPKGEFNGLARMSEVQGVAVYAGKKNEVLVLGNLNANLALGNTRQVFAKVPGTNIWENDGSGMQIGVSTRGLDPNRSWEYNSRQNGYDITADIFGYPEAYFTPPLEAVERIEVVRGASSLQYGAQFGGLVNYVLKEAPPDRRFSFATEQTGGAYGLFNSHNQIGGTLGNLTYNGYYHHRQGEGWRENAGFDANTGFGSIKYQASERLKIGFEFTGLAYLLQMAGGLTDELFNQEPRTSIRNGNWFYLKWLVPALKIDYTLSPSTRISLDVFGLRGTRYSLFNSQPVAFPDGELNLDDPASPRTLFKDRFHNHGLELRVVTRYSLWGRSNVLATGFRYSNGKTIRQQGIGLPGSEPEFDWLVPNVDRNLHFQNINFAGFAENILRVTEKLSITPGLRLDYIDSSGTGRPIQGTQKRTRTIPLFGLGVSYQVSGGLNLYGNISQAYRATLFNDFWRPDPAIIVDQNLKDMKGYVLEYGFRGRKDNWLYFDAGGFYLKYENRLGLLTGQDAQGQTLSLWTNVSDSRNIGLEAFVEADLTRMMRVSDSKGSLSIFSSVAQLNTRYLDGKLRGNRVEFAPNSIIRSGLTYRRLGFSGTLQYSRVGDQFTDATNTLFTVDAVQGLIPAYKLWDLSGSYSFKKYYVVRAGMNNMNDEHYFNRRATSYPGPGLIPADGRSFYASFGIRY
jgi:Fe(3+) dicitrate transport protein